MAPLQVGQLGWFGWVWVFFLFLFFRIMSGCIFFLFFPFFFLQTQALDMKEGRMGKGTRACGHVLVTAAPG